jgi:hypothetical protein
MDSAQLRAQFGANGRRHVAECYALGTYRDKYLALLTRLAAA